MSKLTGIKCIGPVFDASGYAEWCRSYILCLIEAGVPVTIGTDPVRKTGRPITVEGIHPNLGKKGEILEQHVDKDIDYNVVISWLLPNMALEQMAAESKAKRIVMTLFETNKLHETWPKYCNLLDEVWLPGEFNRKNFRDSFADALELHPEYGRLKNIPIRIFKYPIDFSDYETSCKVNLKHPVTGKPLTEDTYVFYAISQWQERKNFPDLLEAYWSEFTEEDDVVLFLKTYGRDYSNQEHQRIQNLVATLASYCNTKYLAPTAVIRELLSKDQMLGLHRACDCYVSSSRGEGLGLGILEAGLFENPVITNLFGEQASYVDIEKAIIYNHTLRPVTRMGRNSWYTMDQSWACPDVKDMAEKMRWAYENRTLAKQKGQAMKQYLLENCNYESVAKSIVEELEKSLESKPVEGYTKKDVGNSEDSN